MRLRPYIISFAIYLLFLAVDISTGWTWGWYQYPLIGAVAAICGYGISDCIDDLQGSPWIKRMKRKWRAKRCQKFLK